jgi:cytochrome c oxidase assembly protein subunit 11
MYRAICDALGINVLSLSEQRVHVRGRASSAKPGQYPGRHHAHHHGRVRRQCARALGLQARRRSVQVHPGELTTVMYEFRNVQNRTMAAQAIPSYAPHAGQRTSTSWSASASTNTRWPPGEQAQWPVVFVIDPSCRAT